MAERDFIITPDLATNPPTNVRGQNDFRYPNGRLAPQECEILENLNLTEQGTAKKRKGYRPWNSSQISEGGVKAITGLFQATYKAGTRQIEMAGTKVYADDGTTRKDITGSLTLTDHAENRWRSVFLQNQLIATNGTDETVTWGGDFTTPTAASALSGVPWSTCADLVVHRNVLLALNTTESGTNHPTRVRWCDIDKRVLTVDVTSWPADNRAEVYHDGTQIVGGVDGFDRLVLFKTDGLYPCVLEYDTGFIELRILPPQRGFSPVARHSILSHPQFLWVVARDGGYLVRPDFSFELVTRKVQHTWNTLNKGRLQYAVSFLREQDHQVRTLLSSENNTSGHDLMMVFDWETGDVWFDKPTDTLNYASRYIISDEEFDWLGSTDGYVLQGNTGTTDNSSDVNWDIKMSPNDLGYPGRSKSITNFVTLYESQRGSQSVNFVATLDQGNLPSRSTSLSLGTTLQYDSSPASTYDAGLTYPTEQTAEDSFFINRVCQTIAPRWSGSGDFELVGYKVDFTVLE
tara:strand:+ start:356 stop:1909 length:1554 start_codon:yes stop_codon:yes gene_type:complete